MIARLLIAAGLTLMVSQTVATEPVQVVFLLGLMMLIAGGLMVVDEWDEIGVRERIEQQAAWEAEAWERRDREDDHAPAGELPGGPLPAA